LDNQFPVAKRACIALLALLVASCATSPAYNPLSSVPRPVVTWYKDGVATLPLRTIGESRNMIGVAVEIAVNGRKGWFLVDSGSSTSWLTSEFTRSIKVLSTGNKIIVHGSAGTVTHDLVELDSMDVGFARLSHVWVTSGDLFEDVNRELAAKGERRLSGILGLDVMVTLGGSIDLARSTVSFHEMAVPSQPAPGPAHS
jgi:hypothetical protein